MVQKEATGSVRPRGRPRAFDPNTVLRQAQETFWRNGYAATSLDDLSAATGLNRPSLYGAFGDKRALYLATLERSRAEMIGALERGLASPAPLRTVLGGIYAGASAIYASGDVAQRGCFLVGTAVTESYGDADVRRLLDTAFTHIDDLFRARFEADRESLPAAADPGILAPVATGIIHTLAVRARAGAGPDALRKVWEAGVTLICGPG